MSKPWNVWLLVSWAVSAYYAQGSILYCGVAVRYRVREVNMSASSKSSPQNGGAALRDDASGVERRWLREDDFPSILCGVARCPWHVFVAVARLLESDHIDVVSGGLKYGG